MVKRAEKIDSIKIHHISGLGSPAQGGGGGAAAAEKPVVNQALDSIMDMALQLPALKKIGDELGVNLGDEIAQASDRKGRGGKD